MYGKTVSISMVAIVIQRNLKTCSNEAEQTSTPRENIANVPLLAQ
jgi:hypothetical protein